MDQRIFRVRLDGSDRSYVTAWGRSGTATAQPMTTACSVGETVHPHWIAALDAMLDAPGKWVWASEAAAISLGFKPARKPIRGDNLGLAIVSVAGKVRRRLQEVTADGTP